jgi:hypothetical protein
MILKRLLFFIAVAVLAAIPVVVFVQKPQTLPNLLAQFFPSPTPRPVMHIKGIGVIGDSLSDEYQADDYRGYEYAPTTLNWIEQLVKSRRMNFGTWNTWAAGSQNT